MSATTTLTVRDVMSPSLQIVDGLSTVREAIDRMREHNISSVVVDRRDTDDEYGIVVIHDVAEHIIGRNRSADRTNVYEIMTKPVVSLDVGMNIRYAARLLFQLGLSRAIVTEGGDLVGVVTLRELVLRFIPDATP